MDFSPLLKLVRDSQEVYILTHENADADAIGSSIALKMVIEAFGGRARIVARDSVSKIGRALASSERCPIETGLPRKRVDLALFVDMRPIEEIKARKVAVIDHHEGDLQPGTDFAFVDSSYRSASEMVFEFLEYLISRGALLTLPKSAAIQLLCGIVADTGNLRLSTAETLRRMIRIGELGGVEIRDAFDLMRGPQDPSLRMACLKGASRLKIRKAEGYLIAFTQVRSYQGEVANCLLQLGADLAFAGGKKKDLNISARARTSVVAQGLNLAQIMRMVGSRLGGDGGGHAGAAALKAAGEVEQALEMCVREARQALMEISRSPPDPQPADKT